jgi:hypothetical protein
MTLEFIATVIIIIYISWDVTPCSLLESCRRFGKRDWLLQWGHESFYGLETEHFNIMYMSFMLQTFNILVDWAGGRKVHCRPVVPIIRYFEILVPS